MARGGSLDNVVVVSGDRVLNGGGLRYADEFVRHKLLDAVGDLYLAGGPIIGHFRGVRSGHAHTRRLLAALFADPDAWCATTLAEPAARSARSLAGDPPARQRLSRTGSAGLRSAGFRAITRAGKGSGIELMMRSVACRRRGSAAAVLLVALAACGDNRRTRPISKSRSTTFTTRRWTRWSTSITPTAAKTFDQVESQHPYSVWATKSQLMAVYALYEDGKLRRGDHRRRPLYPAASRQPRRRLCLLSEGDLLLHADRRCRPRPEHRPNWR